MNKNFTSKVLKCINSCMDKHYLYWIHLPEHTDIKTQGYVGITTNPNQRFSQHRSNCKNQHLANAIRKYDNLSFDVIEEYSELQAVRDRESELRPSDNIGWNIIPGGDISPMLSESTREKVSRTLKSKGSKPFCENSRSPEAIEKRESAKRANKPQWWHNPITLEYRLIKTASEDIPNGWERGRKPKVEIPKKIRGRDYVCNSKEWKVWIDDELVFEGRNMKSFLRDNGYSSLYSNLTKGGIYHSKKYKKTFRVEH